MTVRQLDLVCSHLDIGTFLPACILARKIYSDSERLIQLGTNIPRRNKSSDRAFCLIFLVQCHCSFICHCNNDTDNGKVKSPLLFQQHYHSPFQQLSTLINNQQHTMSQALVKTRQHLDAFQENQGKWDVKQFIVTVATHLNDDTPTSFDLLPTLEKKRLNYRTQKKWLPSMFKFNTPEYRSQVIGPMFLRAAQKHGCSIHISKHKPVISKGFFRLKFICNRGRCYAATKKPSKGTRKTNTGRPIKGAGKKCPFCFSIYWHEALERWFIPMEQLGCKSHLGHLEMHPTFIKVPMKELEDR